METLLGWLPGPHPPWWGCCRSSEHPFRPEVWIAFTLVECSPTLWCFTGHSWPRMGRIGKSRGPSLVGATLFFQIHWSEFYSQKHCPCVKKNSPPCRFHSSHTDNLSLPYSYSISQEICTRFCCALLCCGYAIVHNEFTWSIYPYSSGLLCWHWGNR